MYPGLGVWQAMPKVGGGWGLSALGTVGSKGLGLVVRPYLALGCFDFRKVGG